MAVVITPGAADANSYDDVAGYRAYWTAHLYNTEALAATDATVETALLMTCRLLTACFKWRGMATDDVQVLPWPRVGMTSVTGRAIPSNVNPQQLKDAQDEWAGIMIREGSDRTVDDPDSKIIGTEPGVTGLTAGPVSLQFDNSSFSTLEAFDAFIRSISADFAYLNKAVPDSVRLILVPSWYVQSQLKRKVLFGAF